MFRDARTGRFYEVSSTKIDALSALSRRNLLLETSTLVVAAALTSGALAYAMGRRRFKDYPPSAARAELWH